MRKHRPHEITQQMAADAARYLGKTAPSLELLPIVLHQTGMRVSEIAALTWDNIRTTNTLHPAILVRASTSKTHQPREIPIRFQLAALLEERRQTTSPSAPIAGIPNWVFRWGPHNRRYTTRAMIYAIARAHNANHTGPVSPHDYRHNFARATLRHSNLAVVQALLGHRSLASTQSYLAPTAEDLRNAIDATWSTEQ